MVHFIRPAEGQFTSGFRSRHRSNHHGLDIAKSGLVEVVAAADGTVVKSYYSNSYGHVVFLQHNLQGEIYESVYAHLRNRFVMLGQVVNQGQRLGFMGNTGNSTGQHLHFELHKGVWDVRKTNAVNPLIYISNHPSTVPQRENSIVPYPGYLIQVGSEGKDVQRIQRAVSVTPDGIFGPVTEKAVKKYQRRHGLKVDGLVGPKTWAMMF
ncbi:peptidoglycan DD-metalloendopeptidase family protein [Salinibacillus xinjiangensis]